MTTVLSVKDLEHSYDHRHFLSFPDFEMTENSNLLILGNSGVGKTTLLHLLALILPVQKGKINLNGQEINELSANKLAKFRAKNIGLIFQQSHFVNSLNALENLQLATYLGKTMVKNNQLNDLLKSLGLDDLKNKPVYQLSGGERQRLGIARALVNSPKIILADEPTSNLDDQNTEKVADLLLSSAANFKANLIIVMHDHRLKSKISNQIML